MKAKTLGKNFVHFTPQQGQQAPQESTLHYNFPYSVP